MTSRADRAISRHESKLQAQLDVLKGQNQALQSQVLELETMNNGLFAGRKTTAESPSPPPRPSTWQPAIPPKNVSGYATCSATSGPLNLPPLSFTATTKPPSPSRRTRSKHIDIQFHFVREQQAARVPPIPPPISRYSDAIIQKNTVVNGRLAGSQSNHHESLCPQTPPHPL
ncbi:hypothetical protein DFS34DRAFT_644184 [Phlyctochytrium arcticum]|nr:hypothetical protein DFS34DRAFT_644184 [Phlyctochytrium arcticum]